MKRKGMDDEGNIEDTPNGNDIADVASIPATNTMVEGETTVVVTPEKRARGLETKNKIVIDMTRKENMAKFPSNATMERKVKFLTPSKVFDKEDFFPLELVRKRSPEFFLVELKGGLEVIYCDNGSMEAFIKPLTDYLFVAQQHGHELQQKLKMLKKLKIFAHVFRRASKRNNVPMSKGDGSTFKRTCMLRYSGPNGSTKEEQKEVLFLLREFMNNYCRQHPLGDYVQMFEIPSDFNQTPGIKEAWDHYILDEDIPRVMLKLLPVKPDCNFAQTEGDAKDAPFSPPFSFTARKFGFGVVEIIDSTGDGKGRRQGLV